MNLKNAVSGNFGMPSSKHAICKPSVSLRKKGYKREAGRIFEETMTNTFLIKNEY